MLDAEIHADGSVEEVSGYVTLPRDRYDELLDTESRVNAMIEVYRIHGGIELEDVLILLGYTKDAREKIERDKARMDKWLKESSQNNTEE